MSNPNPLDPTKPDDTSRVPGWRAGNFTIPIGDHWVEIDGWYHWSERLFLFRIDTGLPGNEKLPPYALHHVPTGRNVRLYPDHKTALLFADWLVSCKEFDRDQPLPFLPRQQLEGQALIDWFGIRRRNFSVGIPTTDERNHSKQTVLQTNFVDVDDQTIWTKGYGGLDSDTLEQPGQLTLQERAALMHERFPGIPLDRCVEMLRNWDKNTYEALIRERDGDPP